MRAKDLMTSPPVLCHVNDTLADAAKKMWDADTGVLPVVNDDGKLTGIVTDRDICMAAYTQGRLLSDLLVNTAMARHVVSATPDSSIHDVEQLMATHQVRRIPIVDAEDKPIGIVAMNDLAREAAVPTNALKQETADLAQTLAAISQHRSNTDHAA